ncbi:hypothetical protein D3C71_1356150 [compost metagenome]
MSRLHCVVLRIAQLDRRAPSTVEHDLESAHRGLRLHPARGDPIAGGNGSLCRLLPSLAETDGGSLAAVTDDFVVAKRGLGCNLERRLRLDASAGERRGNLEGGLLLSFAVLFGRAGRRKIRLLQLIKLLGGELKVAGRDGLRVFRPQAFDCHAGFLRLHPLQFGSTGGLLPGVLCAVARSLHLRSHARERCCAAGGRGSGGLGATGQARPASARLFGTLCGAVESLASLRAERIGHGPSGFGREPHLFGGSLERLRKIAEGDLCQA